MLVANALGRTLFKACAAPSETYFWKCCCSSRQIRTLQFPRGPRDAGRLHVPLSSACSEPCLGRSEMTAWTDHIPC